MKFLYEYRTPDNAKHSGAINAADKEAAYAALKREGIKPCRFAEAPGFFNKVFGKGKRWIAIGVLGVGCLVLGGVAYLTQGELRQAQSTEDLISSTLRRQPFGDSAVIAKGIRTGWADFFELPGDRFLAAYALPGIPPAVQDPGDAEIEKALAAQHSASAADTLEARQVRAILDGMKQELRDYLAEGGTIAKYKRRLMRRQQEEVNYYNRAKSEVEMAAKSKMTDAALEELWEKRNAQLRCMGIKLIVLPEREVGKKDQNAAQPQ